MTRSASKGRVSRSVGVVRVAGAAAPRVGDAAARVGGARIAGGHGHAVLHARKTKGVAAAGASGANGRRRTSAAGAEWNAGAGAGAGVTTAAAALAPALARGRAPIMAQSTRLSVARSTGRVMMSFREGSAGSARGATGRGGQRRTAPQAPSGLLRAPRLQRPPALPPPHHHHHLARQIPVPVPHDKRHTRCKRPRRPGAVLQVVLQVHHLLLRNHRLAQQGRRRRWPGSRAATCAQECVRCYWGCIKQLQGVWQVFCVAGARCHASGGRGQVAVMAHGSCWMAVRVQVGCACPLDHLSLVCVQAQYAHYAYFMPCSTSSLVHCRFLLWGWFFGCGTGCATGTASMSDEVAQGIDRLHLHTLIRHSRSYSGCQPDRCKLRRARVCGYKIPAFHLLAAGAASVLATRLRKLTFEQFC